MSLLKRFNRDRFALNGNMFAATIGPSLLRHNESNLRGCLVSRHQKLIFQHEIYLSYQIRLLDHVKLNMATSSDFWLSSAI